MKIFFGSAIQGAPVRGMRQQINAHIIRLIKSRQHQVVADHTSGRSAAEVAELLEAAIGPLPPRGIERTRYVRKKMIEAIEGDIGGAIFEVSLPSIGTGDELAHAYLRPRLSLPEIPILILYQANFWPNDLSAMVRGLPLEELANIQLHEYYDQSALDEIVRKFLDWLE